MDQERGTTSGDRPVRDLGFWILGQVFRFSLFFFFLKFLFIRFVWDQIACSLIQDCVEERLGLNKLKFFEILTFNFVIYLICNYSI